MSLLFIFDMDDVLYHFDWKQRMVQLTALTGLSFDELSERWWNTHEETAEAGGFADADTYFAAFREALGGEITEEEWVSTRGEAMTPWPDSLAAVRRAAELGTVTLLTNNGPLTARHLRTLAPELVDIFGDHLFTSSDYGARKPNPVVFERVLAAYETPAERAFFADDMIENVAGAASIGITAHHFTSSAKLHSAIEEFGAARRA